jgi:hypothetical protein
MKAHRRGRVLGVQETTADGPVTPTTSETRVGTGTLAMSTL